MRMVPVSFPGYFVEDRAQASSLLGMNAFDEAQPANQVFAKMGMSVAVLVSWPMAGAVGEYRLQQIKIRPPHIEALVGHQAREVLAHRLAHNARLAMVDGEALVLQDHRSVRSETLYRAMELFAAGEGEIVRVT